MIRLLFKLFLFLLPIALFGVPLLLVLSGVQSTALVQPGSSMDHGDVDRIKSLLRQHDPRGIRDGEFRRLAVTSRDLNLALNYALRNTQRSRSSVQLDEHAAIVRYSYALPDNPLGKFFNLSVALKQVAPRLSIEHIEFGRIKVAGQLMNPLMNTLDSYLRRRSVEYRGIMDSVASFELAPDELQLVYQLQAELVDQLQNRGRDLLLPEHDRRAVAAYYNEIATRSRDSQATGAFTDLLMHLFKLARVRTDSGNDARSEHRALFLALGVVVSGSSLDTLVGDQVMSSARPAPMRLALVQRGDLAQHFALSAAISAAAGTGLADAVGIFKELNDSRGGSGFSFVDLLADRAGVALASAAMGADAAKIQRRMSAGLQESDFMPDIDKLPEGLLELEFKSRYEDLDSRDYATVNDEIERRLSRCKIYQ